MSVLQRCKKSVRVSGALGLACVKSAALLSAFSMLFGLVGAVSASAQPVPRATEGRQDAPLMQPDSRSLPDKVVDYDFSSTTASSVNNGVNGSSFGPAKVTANGIDEVAGVYRDNALSMTGNYYVKLPDGILQGLHSATVSTVVSNDEFNSGPNPWTYLWSLGGTGQEAKGSWTVSTHTSLYSSITSKGNGSGELVLNASDNLSTGRFQTLTATFDGATKKLTLYINGRSVGSKDAEVDISRFSNQTNDVIGQSRYPGVGDAFYHGAVRSFTVYDQAMTPGQIARILPADAVGDLLSGQAAALQVPASANADFTLPMSVADAGVTWTSDNPVIAIGDRGKAVVTLPQVDTRVTLTARLTPGAGIASPNHAVTKTFVVTVPKRLTRDEFRKKVFDSLSLDGIVNSDNVRGDILLPSTLNVNDYGFVGDIAWASDNTKLVGIDGGPRAKVGVQNDDDDEGRNAADDYVAKVRRPDCGGAQEVRLIASVSDRSLAGSGGQRLGSPVTKTFVLSVQPMTAGDDATHTRVTSHDPSIVKANGRYYIFGSHRAFAKSTDLQHWQYLSNNLVTDYHRVLDRAFASWPSQRGNNDVSGNMWAPEVIWNSTMNKWCMYLSLNGGGFPYQKTMIVLLTADDIEGDWTYVGPVVYSGFNKSNYMKTDVPKVLGVNPDLTRYDSLEDTGINAIDASVKYDGKNLWMAFGSWFGGIWMIRLDPTTGLRDYGIKYQTVKNVSDAYYGHKLAGGFGNSGEGAALAKDGGYWYLMLSYGGFGQTGGYQMREFRSRSITGPYLDQNGNAAVYTQKVPNDTAFNRGLRILSSYDQPGSENVKTSQGGNAILSDSDGSIYNVFHTRYVRSGAALEEHQVRVQPMVLADGWLVMAPYEKSGSIVPGSSITVKKLAGDYRFVVHNPVAFYSGGGETSPAIYHSVNVTLKEDGTLGGDGIAGAWKVDGGKVTLLFTAAPAAAKLHGTYMGTVGYQTDETGIERLFISGLGGDVFADAGPDATSHEGRAAFWGMRALPRSGTLSGQEIPCSANPVGVMERRRFDPIAESETASLPNTGCAVSVLALFAVGAAGLASSLLVFRYRRESPGREK
ncbi:family 43 glycosylhydrolase [Bifidobacterium bohemicum]|uniref:family 43 glycosylhydrolase n=2 Tax=Bifidobacterium bohemicum TaxID=638617 RepID=UPI0013764C62|nr:family 43 glycosylhydrolase [Bifidobacterium bohemicum]